jgi:MoxR-like ATPase
MFDTIENTQQAMADHHCIANRALSTVIFLAARLSNPLFLEGEAGAGKTEVAKVLSSILDTQLICLRGQLG